MFVNKYEPRLTNRTSVRRTVAVLGIFVAAMAVLVACGQGGRQLAGNLASRTVTATNAGSSLAGSELVNGNSPTKHIDDLSKTIEEVSEAEKSPPPKPRLISSSGGSGSKFNPSMCKSIAEGGTGFFAFYGSLATGNLGKLGDYCRSLDNQRAQSTPVQSSEQGNGCVWKGQSYGPGESIFHTDGQILSSDLTVYGENFGSLSGKSGPWQQCQCGTSSGKWGCV